MNDDNLIPLTERTDEEARAIRSAGGRAVQKIKAERRKASEAMRMLLDLPCASASVRVELAKMGISDEDMNNQSVMLASTMAKAMKGDTNAVKLVLEIIGELKQNVSVETEGMAIVVKADTAGNLAKILSNENRND